MSVNLSRLLAGEALTREETHGLFEAVIRGELSDVELTALLVALKLKGETPQEIAGAAAALREGARAFPRPDYRFADIVGTGGDGASTINISTAVSFVAAEAGLPVAKHGNRSVSSRCGAADLLEQFGVSLEMSPATARRCLDEQGVSFLFAPHYHSGIRHAMPVRKALSTRTLFNILGPLVNPARPPIMLVGVYAPDLCAVVAETLKLLGCERALVVNGLGLDEIALHGETRAAELVGGEVITRRFAPVDFGVREFPLSAIVGGAPEDNAAAIRALLGGQGSEAHRAAVAVNAGALLYLGGLAADFREGFERAQAVLDGDGAYRRLERLAALSRDIPLPNPSPARGEGLDNDAPGAAAFLPLPLRERAGAKGILAEIVERKRADVAERRAALPLEVLRARVEPSTRSLAEGLARPGARFILECKKASPSEGVLRADYDPAAIARVYAPFAAGISVLCDTPYFQGGFEHLRAVREAVDTPILCKDFVVEPYQVVEARHHGADAVLLMLSVLSDGEYLECAAAARDLGMDVLTEVHDEAELERALALGAKIIGINNRDLKTLKIDRGTTARLAPKIPEDRLVVCESGIRCHGDVRAVAGVVDGFLVGSHLMKAARLDLALRELIFGRVKICGLRDAQSRDLAYGAGANLGGMIFAAGSPRCLNREQARAIAEASPLPLMGVFVDAPLRQVAEYAEELDLAAVQLHGSESPEYVRALRGQLATHREIWKALRIAEARPDLSAYAVDRFLLDTYRPGAAGGTGEVFDWSLLDGLKDKSRLILAGGLNPDNIRAAAASGVQALDVNSGVESAPGVKDEQKLRRLFAALRGE